MTSGQDPQRTAAKARDDGQRAFEEGQALLECLREACSGESTMHMGAAVTVLQLVEERLTAARGAFDLVTREI